MASLIQTLRDFWLTATGQRPDVGTAAPAVVVHDPAGQQPHDLDDPFFDDGVQSRMAGVIADSAAKKPQD